jgi:hypothetical protein
MDFFYLNTQLEKVGGQDEKLDSYACKERVNKDCCHFEYKAENRLDKDLVLCAFDTSTKLSPNALSITPHL